MQIVVRRSVQIVFILVAMSCARGYAQDTRVVTEPVIPPSCTVLKAQLFSEKGAFADADEAKLDTARIQRAMDKCPKGQAVELAIDGAPNPYMGKTLTNAFLSAPLELRAGVTLLVDKGVTLYASRNPRDYDLGPGTCGVVNNEKSGCKPFITAKNANGIGIMGDGTIDGRGGAKLLGGKESWWDLAVDAGKNARQQVPRLINTDHCDDFTVYRITLKNSANFHLVPHNTNGMTVWGLKIDTPATTRNTDGFDPSASSNITVTQSYIRDGDDNIAIKAGDGPVTHMTVIHNHFYYGHGMSIGSETSGGVSGLLVRDLSLDGTTAGIRIKSNTTRGGLVNGAQYDDICIRNAKYPIALTTDYFLTGKLANSLPSYEGILLHNVRISGGGKIQLEGYDATHRVGIRLDGVMLMDGPGQYKVSTQHADVTLGPGPVNIPMGGTDSTLAGKAGAGNLPGCSDKFVPFPITQ